MNDTRPADSDGLTRSVGFVGLLFTSEGSIIGSGWLFGALFAATIGGPAAIIAWLIGSVAVILLALVLHDRRQQQQAGGAERAPHQRLDIARRIVAFAQPAPGRPDEGTRDGNQEAVDPMQLERTAGQVA